MRRAPLAARLFAAAWLACAFTGCAAGTDDGAKRVRFWAMGREGEVVTQLVRRFESENPGIVVEVQQIPWTAAHEKLLTAHVGGSTPDVAQLGNTWIPEFAALGAIAPLDTRLASSPAIDSSGYFGGIWQTNVIDGSVYGVPWYVDTRVLFYRKDLLARAGYGQVPTTWSEWLAASRAIRRDAGESGHAIYLPTNEWAQPVILGLQAGSPLLADNATRAVFSEPAFRQAFDTYVQFFREDLAPAVGNNEIANLYQEFARGAFALYITGPWNIGEFRSRLPAELQDDWGTAPLPGPTGPGSGVSLAGGSSLVLFRNSKRQAEGWRLVEFLSRPEVQVEFYGLTGDLPARRAAWQDSALSSDPALEAFAVQLERTVPTPKVPEWEEVAARLVDACERVIRGGTPADEALAALDREVDRILEKRRWLRQRQGSAAHGESRAPSAELAEAAP